MRSYVLPYSYVKKTWTYFRSLPAGATSTLPMVGFSFLFMSFSDCQRCVSWFIRRLWGQVWQMHQQRLRPAGNRAEYYSTIMVGGCLGRRDIVGFLRHDIRINYQQANVPRVVANSFTALHSCQASCKRGLHIANFHSLSGLNSSIHIFWLLFTKWLQSPLKESQITLWVALLGITRGFVIRSFWVYSVFTRPSPR